MSMPGRTVAILGKSLGDYRGDDAPSERGLELREPPFVVYVQADAVAGQPQSEPARDTGRQVSPVGGGRYQHREGRVTLDEVGHGTDVWDSVSYSASAGSPFTWTVSAPNAVSSRT